MITHLLSDGGTQSLRMLPAAAKFISTSHLGCHRGLPGISHRPINQQPSQEICWKSSLIARLPLRADKSVTVPDRWRAMKQRH